jgi:hypothetical protein
MAAVDPVAGQAARLEQLSTGEDGEADRPRASDRSTTWKVVRQVSSTAFLSLLMATFACIGFVLAIVMGRLGHSPFAWGLLGLLLGPIALLLALVEVRNERPWWTRLVASGDPGSCATSWSGRPRRSGPGCRSETGPARLPRRSFPSSS